MMQKQLRVEPAVILKYSKMDHGILQRIDGSMDFRMTFFELYAIHLIMTTNQLLH